MNRFILTKFVLTLEKASQKDIALDVHVLKKEYGKFALLVLSEGIAVAGKSDYRNALVYTRVELSGLTAALRKKMQRQSFF